MSGLEMAMWDILGKSLNAPVYTLLGGPCQDRIKIYHNGWWFPAKNLDDYVELARQEVERGAKALKWDPFWGIDVFTATRDALAAVVDNVRKVREAVGADVELMLDGHSRLSPNMAIQFAQAVEEYKPAWYEEPIPTDASPEDLAQVTRSTSIPIVVGERVVTRWCFRDIFEKRAAAIINPDIGHAGGILETKKIADMAHAYYVGVTPHNAGGPVLNAAALHLDASIPNFVINEFFAFDRPYWEEILTGPFPALREGYLDLPSGPGLGVEIDEAALEKAKKPYVYHDMSGFWRTPQQPSSS
jgi:galactonate dehydratase